MRVVSFEGDTWCARVDEGDVRGDLLRIADAVGRLSRSSRLGASVYVGYDARALSVDVAREFGDVIASHGVRTLVSGVHCPMAALCEAVRRDAHAFAGIMLTGGNRSADYAGVRIRISDGSAASPSDTDALETLVPSDVPCARGRSEEVDVVTPYLERTAAFLRGWGGEGRGPLVVCDVMHGALVGHASRLLGGMGARVVPLHDETDECLGGLHPDAAEPWVDDCEQAVRDNGADLGLAIDGDGNRLALVDERGSLVTPHVMLAILMEHLVRNYGITGRMVAPIFVSTIVRRQAERLGMPLTVTPAGYQWMREEMATGDVVCAGDALGGVCVPVLGLERDALGVAALLVEAVASDGRKLSEIVAALGDELGHMVYGQVEVRLTPAGIQVLRNALPGLNPSEIAGERPVSVSHPGGLMARFADGSWLLLRPSRSRPAALLAAEAPAPPGRDRLLAAGRALALAPLGPRPLVV